MRWSGESYKGTSIRITLELLSETMQTRREWSEILSVERRKSQPRLYIQQNYPSKVKEKQSLSQKNKTEENDNRLFLHKMLKEVLQGEGK